MQELSNAIIYRKLWMEEGYSNTLYKCSKGKWTGGTGINVEVQEIPHEAVCLWQDECPDLNIRGSTKLMLGILIMENGLPDVVWTIWMERILTRLTAQVECKLYGEYDLNFGDLPEDCQLVVMDCCYQMGVDGFFAFKKTLTHIKNMDYVDAAFELMNSKYAQKDTPERAQRNSELLIDCACKL